MATKTQAPTTAQGIEQEIARVRARLAAIATDPELARLEAAAVRARGADMDEEREQLAHNAWLTHRRKLNSERLQLEAQLVVLERERLDALAPACPPDQELERLLAAREQARAILAEQDIESDPELQALKADLADVHRRDSELFIGVSGTSRAAQVLSEDELKELGRRYD